MRPGNDNTTQVPAKFGGRPRVIHHQSRIPVKRPVSTLTYQVYPVDARRNSYMYVNSINTTPSCSFISSLFPLQQPYRCSWDACLHGPVSIMLNQSRNLCSVILNLLRLGRPPIPVPRFSRQCPPTWPNFSPSGLPHGKFISTTIVT